MAARTGAQLLDRLAAASTHVEIQGETLTGGVAEHPAFRNVVRSYLQAATLPGADRVRLFRLAWDTCVSAFAGRQALYEYYFSGDPVRMAGAYAGSYDTSPYADRVRDFLRRR